MSLARTIKQPATTKSSVGSEQVTLRVTHYLHQEPIDTWASDMDYHGYTEFEFEIWDRTDSRRLFELEAALEIHEPDGYGPIHKQFLDDYLT